MLARSRVALFWKTKVDPNAPIKFVRIPNKTPTSVALEKGKTYYWCSCGLSAKQPFCDGAHKAYNEKHNTSLKPLQFTAEESKKKLLCRCKNTQSPPYCDLSHLGVIFRTAIGTQKTPSS